MTEKLSHLARVRLVKSDRIEKLRSILETREGEDVPEDLFFWDAEISNDLLDSHFTHMSEKTLKNYAADAEKGVAFLRGHNWQELPLGYSLQGVYEESDGRKRVMAGFYTVRSIPDAADLIQRMKVGLVRDVSVGFHGGSTVCDLCGEEFWDCRHFPGLKYEEKDGDTVRTQLATFTIDDANLSEVSGVFDGSTPEAMIRKAERAVKAGELSQEQIGVLERRYRTRLPSRSVHPVVKEENMDLTQIRALLGVDADDKIEEGVQTLQRRVAELEPQAKDGVQYRTDLIEQALAEGVRAYGDSFERSLYEDTFKTAPLTLIKRMRDDWKKAADLIFKGGRQSDNGDVTPQPKGTFVPDRAYQ